MTPRRSTSRTTRAIAVLAIALFALGAVGAIAARELTAETAQAGALVTLGKSALAKGDPAAAVLAFERARLLAPRAEEVRSALASAGATPLGPPVARTVSWITLREWSLLSVGLGWTAALSLAIAIVRGRKGRVAGLAAFCSGVAFVLSMGGVVESNLVARTLAVVTGPTGVLLAPYGAAGATADLRAGSVVVIGERYGDFVQVRSAEGVSGWVVSTLLHRVLDAGA
jgi:hypothetical protein